MKDKQAQKPGQSKPAQQTQKPAQKPNKKK